MGVKDLWNILSPLCDTKSLYELQGKTVAIDLSGWVVDSQTIVDNAIQPKMYLRNLYFRTAFLLMQGISPVFVLEGKAPTIKHKTIARRNDVRNKFQERKTAKKCGRTQFNRILNQCKEMLKYMGIDCIQGYGEAEAMCAYLNEDGLVDGCISQDSDCFLYGAKVVYRNFCTSTQMNRGATSGSVDIYSMEKIEKTLKIGRNKMIALALLCGCDYDVGVNGVGKEAALKFFKTVEDREVLQRMQEWRTDKSLDRVETDLLNPDLCTSCGHQGKLRKHMRLGCDDCGTVRECNDHFREKRILMLNEVSLRKKALRDENFPNHELIEEFLVRRDPIPTKLDIEWKQPVVNQFVNFMNKHLCWEPQYAFEKIFTLSTRWQLLHLPSFTLDQHLSMPDLFVPDAIKKIRNIKSTASYEIIWKKEHNVFKMLKEYKEETQKNTDDNVDSLLTSIEPQNLVLKCYPQLIEAFENIRNMKTKKRTAISRVKKTATNVVENSETKSTKSRQTKIRKKPAKNKGNKKISEYISCDNPVSLEDSFEKMTITPKRSKQAHILHKEKELKVVDASENCTIMNVKQMKCAPQFRRVLEIEMVNARLNNTIDRMFNELSSEDFMSENEDNDLNITDIIEDICSKQIVQFNNENDQFLKFVDQSEESATEICKSINRSDLLTNVEKHIYIEDEREKLDDSNDEFSDINELYIPIDQRIQNENKKLSQMCNQIKKRSFNFEKIMDETNNESIHLDT